MAKTLYGKVSVLSSGPMQLTGTLIKETDSGVLFDYKLKVKGSRKRITQLIPHKNIVMMSASSEKGDDAIDDSSLLVTGMPFELSTVFGDIEITEDGVKVTDDEGYEYVFNHQDGVTIDVRPESGGGEGKKTKSKPAKKGKRKSSDDDDNDNDNDDDNDNEEKSSKKKSKTSKSAAKEKKATKRGRPAKKESPKKKSKSDKGEKSSKKSSNKWKD